MGLNMIVRPCSLRFSTRHIMAAAMIASLLAAAAPLTARQSGLTPLSDLGSDTYLGFEGGLYAGGSNEPPAAHAAAALQQAMMIRPLNAQGIVDPRGVIGFLAVGMSNTNQEFKVFERAADNDAQRHARLVFLNGALGGQAADVISDPAAPYWTNLDARVLAAGLDPSQIQVVWLKQAQTQPVLDFPDHALNLKSDLRAIVQILRERFVNLRICYLSSRIYGGYAVNPLRSEPLSYETGFSFKWLIEEQIAGDPELNFDPAAGPVKAPLLLWGPYLWADGPEPRSDGLTWIPDDFEPDMVHPAPPGEAKAGALLSAFYALAPSAAPWYDARPGVSLQTVPAEADATIDLGAPDTNFGATHQLHAGAAPAVRRFYLRFPLAAGGMSVTHAKLGLRTLSQIDATALHSVSDVTWDELTVTWNTAPPIDGGTLHLLPFHAPDGTLSAGVTELAQNAPSGPVSFAVTGTATAPSRFQSRESGEPPLLVLTLLSACGRADLVPDGVINSADLLALLTAWGTSGGPADLNDDGIVDSADLLELLAVWGPC